ncbi:MAG: acyltransferase 3 [Bradyrhizobium sp.]|nr:acyltransferase 3 [Bradyrhizobium sp.]
MNKDIATFAGQNQILPKKFAGIQILRFIAALAVVCFHAQGTAPTYFSGPFTLRFLAYGNLGVDLFFVISGFIICYTVRTRESKPGIFFRRRIERIVPIYWLFTIGLFALLNLPGLARTTATPSVEDLGLSLFFLKWTTGMGAEPVVYVGWSLEFEILFYTVFAVVMIRFRKPWEITAGILTVGVIIGNLALPNAENCALGFLVHPLVLEFVMGIACAEFAMDRRPPLWLGALLLIGLVTLNPHGWGARVLTGGLFGLLLVFVVSTTNSGRLMRAKIMQILVTLGDASYSLYLVQALSIPVACRIFKKLMPMLTADMAIVIVSLFSVAAGYLCYIAVERPLGRLIRRRGRRIANDEIVSPTPTA